MITAPIDENQQTDAIKITQLLHTGAYSEAELTCRVLLLQYNHIKTHRLWFYLGVALFKQNKLDAALQALETATQQHPNDLEAWKAGAAVLIALQQFPQAYLASQAALHLAPQSAECLANLGVAIEQLVNHKTQFENIPDAFKKAVNHLTLQHAVNCYEQALAIEPQQPIALTNLAVIHLTLGNPQSSQICAQKLVHSWPNNISGYINLAEALIQQLQFEEALNTCAQGLAIAQQQPQLSTQLLASLTFKYGLVLAYLQQFSQSATAIMQAKSLDAEVVNDYFPEMGAIAKARDSEIIAVPELIFLNAAYQQQARCDWRMRDAYVNGLTTFLCNQTSEVQLEVMVQFGFEILSIPLSAADRFTILKRIAARYVDVSKSDAPFQFTSKPAKNKKIRIGYLSPDFRMHPVGLLTANLYGLHDKEKFEVYAYSLFTAPNANTNIDVVTLKIKQGCDDYQDMHQKRYQDIAQKIQQDGIDILVDLAGYTTHSKFEVCALKPAPIQVAYLGYPNTTGAPFIDYILLDKTVCLPDDTQYYSEKVVRLPDAYCPFDTSASNAPTTYTRAENNLPEEAIVLCCFNTNYKIEPQIFACWMRILKAVPNAVLWLVAMRDDVIHRLNAEAALQGVAKSRLIFASYMPHERHIGRYQLADLFLDTYWHNAHTTAADALWQGLPVITCMGEVQSARLAASLLNALHMPELIANSLQEYEILAIYYATNHQARDAMRAKLKNNRTHAPLFNIPRTVKNIEAAYQTIWQRYCEGLLPEAFDVEIS